MIAKKTIYIGAGLIFLIAALLLAPLIAFGATSDSLTATFTLNATPVVSNVNFVDSAYASTATLTPDNTAIFGVDFDVSLSSGMTDILNVTIYIFDDSVHGADFNTTPADGDELITILWIEATDTWSIDQGAFSEWTMQSPIDPGIGNASTTGDFRAMFDISWAAAASADWNASVFVFDDDGTPEYDFASEVAFVTMNNNFDISYSVTTISWGNDIVPSSVNNTQLTAVTVQIRANAQWETSASAVDFTPGPIDVEALLILIWDEDNSAGGNSVQIQNTENILEGTWDNQVRMPGEANVTRSYYVFLSADVGGWSVGQLYTTTISIFIAANT